MDEARIPTLESLDEVKPEPLIYVSWSKIKSFFYRQEGAAPQADLIRILNTNYRLSLRVEGEWRNIFALLSFDMIAHVHSDEYSHLGGYDYNAMCQHYVERFADRIKTYTEQGCWNEYF